MDTRSLQEVYLLRLLDEVKRLIVAEAVVYKEGVSRYEQRLKPENQIYAKSVSNVIHDKILDSLFTALLVNMGYRLPQNELYCLPDYSALCDWLGSKEEDGAQKWEGG